MPCLKLPIPEPPTLPSPFTLGAPLPPKPPGLSAALCCKKGSLPDPPPIPPLPPKTVNPAIVATVNNAMKVVREQLIDKLQVKCPRE